MVKHTLRCHGIGGRDKCGSLTTNGPFALSSSKGNGSI
jgi:hypothetical protein